MAWLVAGVRLVACGAALATVLAVGSDAAGAPRPDGGAWSFVSAPHLHPVKLQAEGPVAYSRLAPGYFLLTDGGATIFDQHLQPVWFRPGSDADLKEQTFEGKPVLTWWQGSVSRAGIGHGVLYVVDEHYRVVAKLTAARGWHLDMHEAVISGNDVWVTAYRLLQHVRVPGARRRVWLLDEAVQAYDLRNDRLLYTWDAFNPGRAPHVPLWQSDIGAPRRAGIPWDAYHENSLQLVGSNEFLVSMRYTSAAYLVDFSTGEVLWTLGGKASSFQIPAAARFSFQHDVLLGPGGLVTLFDDACCALVGPHRSGVPNGPSRGLVLKLDFNTRTVSLVHQYLHEPPLHADALGSMQQLANGDVLVGWGTEPYFSEYSASGKLLLDARFPAGAESYRALLTPRWVGTPFYPPSAAVEDLDGDQTVYASWNGATQVADWEVLIGSSPGSLRPVAREPRNGLETAIPLGHQAFTRVQVEALNARGAAIGSRTLTVS